MRPHIIALGRFMIGVSVFYLLVAISILIGMLASISGHIQIHPAGFSVDRLVLFVTAVCTVVGVVVLPGIVVGLGLIRRAAWARPWAVVLLILGIFTGPLGILLGIYGLWVLYRPDCEAISRPLPYGL